MCLHSSARFMSSPPFSQSHIAATQTPSLVGKCGLVPAPRLIRHVSSASHTKENNYADRRPHLSLTTQQEVEQPSAAIVVCFTCLACQTRSRSLHFLIFHSPTRGPIR